MKSEAFEEKMFILGRGGVMHGKSNYVNSRLFSFFALNDLQVPVGISQTNSLVAYDVAIAEFGLQRATELEAKGLNRSIYMKTYLFIVREPVICFRHERSPRLPN